MGGGKGGSGGGDPYGQMAYQNAYNAAQQGTGWDPVASTFQGQNAAYLDYGRAGWEAGRPVAPMHFPEFGVPHAPSASASASASGPTYEQQLADQQAMQDQAAAEAARAAGIAERDQLFGAYMDAAGSSTDYINSEIQREQSNARLLGIDYSIDDSQKSQRINDYFASVWGEGQQSRLEALMSEWGNPQGFKGWTVQRGDGSAYKGQGAGEASEGVSQGITPKESTIVTDVEEEEGLGGTGSVLGV